MTILNYDTLYYLYTSNYGTYQEIRSDSTGNFRDNFVWPQYEESNELFYGFEFNTGLVFNVFPLNTLITENDIDNIRTGKAKLVLSNSHEAFHDYVEELYKILVIEYRILPSNIILISESADIASHIKKVAASLGLEEMKSRWMRRFEYDVMHAKRIILEDNPNTITLEDKVYDKKFLCFNRRWRGHRTALVALLKATNQLGNGYVSLGKSDIPNDWLHVCFRDQYFMQGHPEAMDLLRSVQDELSTSFSDLYLDNTDLVTNRANLVTDTDYLYSSSYFSLVTETFFFRAEMPNEYGRFMSEKTFKPVAMKHPFIVLSVPHFLDKFRELGYKSFSPWINEDYDLEHDDATRMMKIVRETERLSNLSPEELKDFLTAMRDICEHNYQLLINKTESSDWFTDL